MKTLAVVPIGFVCIASLIGCVHYGQFRNDARKNGSIPESTPKFCEDDPEADLSRKSLWCPKGESKYYLAFIEVDEFGEMFNRKQLNNAMTLIQRAKHESKTMDPNGSRTNNAIVITFVYGWKNNASDNSGNVWGFRDSLNDIGATLDRAFSERKAKGTALSGEEPEPVVGIYIGWRGAVTNLGVVKEFTFFDRRNAAARIPGAHLTEILSEIVHETKACINTIGGIEHIERCPKNSAEGPGTGSLSIIVGHSFGGLVLERTLTQAVTADLLSQEAERKDRQRRHDEKPGGNFIKPTSNLIVMVNEAAPATESKQLLDLLRCHKMQLCVRDPLTGHCIENHPLFLSITSAGDWATGLTLPIGQGASSLFRKNFRKYDNPKPPQIPNQRTYYLHSTAHLPPLFSHLLGREQDESIQQAITSARGKGRQSDIHCYDSGILKRRYCIVPMLNGYNDMPYWVMQMGTEFVPDHSQIFRPAFRELLGQFVQRKIDLTKRGAPLKPATIQIGATTQSQ